MMSLYDQNMIVLLAHERQAEMLAEVRQQQELRQMRASDTRRTRAWHWLRRAWQGHMPRRHVLETRGA